VTGVAEKDALVFINNQKVLVNENGEFSEDVGLQSGPNMITVKARSKFNKEATQSVSVNADFQNSVPATNVQNLTQFDSQQSVSAVPFVAEVSVGASPLWLSVEVDGEVKYSGVLESQNKQTFNVASSLSITSAKGSETFVKINNRELGALSTEPTIAKDVVYQASGKVENNKQ